MKQYKRYHPLLSTGISFFLVATLLVPIGLKLEHAFDYHSQSIECALTKTHIHSSSSHNDLLDYFSQPLVYDLNEFFVINNLKIEQKVLKYYSYLFYSKTYKGIGLRAPPLFIYT